MGIDRTMTRDKQAVVSPAQAIDFLKEGNQRFVDNKPVSRYFQEQIQYTASGQYPFAFVLSCIDSRVPVEIIFDLGIGDVFSGRIAGNFANTDLLGSMEFACGLAGAKLVLVMGHTSCGAVKGAIDGGASGNLAQMLQHFDPVLKALENDSSIQDKSSANENYVTKIVEQNVIHTMDVIRKESPMLTELEEKGAIQIVGSVYDVTSGKVSFL